MVCPPGGDGDTEMSGRAERLIRSRHATRAFRPEAVPEDTMHAIFSLAGAAPSSSNTQPWQVEVVSGAARDRLANALHKAQAERRTSADFPYSEGMYSEIHHARKAAFGAELYGALGISRDDHMARAAYNSQSLRFYGAPHAAFLFVNGDGGARPAADVGAYMLNGGRSPGLAQQLRRGRAACDRQGRDRGRQGPFRYRDHLQRLRRNDGHFGWYHSRRRQQRDRPAQGDGRAVDRGIGDRDQRLPCGRICVYPGCGNRR